MTDDRTSSPSPFGGIPEKERLRIRLKEKRAQLPAADAMRCSMRITEHLLALLNGHRTVMVYVSKEGEADTHVLIDRLLERRIAVVVPVIERETTSLRLSYLKNRAHLRVSTFNVPEPIGNEIAARPGDIDAAVIPLVGFDSRGNRLGYGAGYYDRFLSSHPDVLRIGIGFACQKADRIPCEIFDIRMDYIITEEGIIRCSGTASRES
ncbi:MAG: 5-formyltetrahydrofolate cyclo-ligase [Methanoculleus sp. SDB]|nr:MAG: 5-formyltetrahydrofolate cyclo-ligase [Methanoculleus sp. SDB]